jgi:hypothetical protein
MTWCWIWSDNWLWMGRNECKRPWQFKLVVVFGAYIFNADLPIFNSYGVNITFQKISRYNKWEPHFALRNCQKILWEKYIPLYAKWRPGSDKYNLTLKFMAPMIRLMGHQMRSMNKNYTFFNFLSSSNTVTNNLIYDVLSAFSPTPTNIYYVTQFYSKHQTLSWYWTLAVLKAN